MQEMIWITRKRERLRVADMETSHIHNALAMIRRSRTGWRAHFIPRLEIELEIRKLKGV